MLELTGYFMGHSREASTVQQTTFFWQEESRDEIEKKGGNLCLEMVTVIDRALAEMRPVKTLAANLRTLSR
jgi:hypothetical protein